MKPRPGPGNSASSDRRELRASATVFGVIIALSIFIYLVRGILLPFIFAGILAYVCTPLVDRLSGRSTWPRWLFALAVLLALLALALLIGFFGWRPLAHEISHVTADLQGSVQALAEQFIGHRSFKVLGANIDSAQIAASASHEVRQWLNSRGSILTILTSGFIGFFGFILSWVLLGYFLLDAPRISQGLFWLVPPHHRALVHAIWARLDPVLQRYFVGIALVVLYAASVAYIGLGLILGLRHPMLLALLTGLLETIPLVGPFASAVIAGLVAVKEAAGAWNIIAYVIYAVVLRISIDEFFGPIVLGKAAYVRPVMVIFCFLAGATLFGIAGVVLAIPVALTIKISLEELYQRIETEDH